jgi:hypothetical protein
MQAIRRLPQAASRLPIIFAIRTEDAVDRRRLQQNIRCGKKAMGALFCVGTGLLAVGIVGLYWDILKRGGISAGDGSLLPSLGLSGSPRS